MTDHPITPPDELVQEWINKHYGCKVHREFFGLERTIATQAARWGADIELDACCEWMGCYSAAEVDARDLRLARRPKPPSLKERIATAIAHGDACIALELLDQALPS